MDAGKPAQQRDTRLYYPYQLLAKDWTAFAGMTWRDVPYVLGFYLTFFVPALPLFFRARTQTVIHIVAAGPALAWLMLMVALYGEVKVGGILALAGWSMLLLLGLFLAAAAFIRRRGAAVKQIGEYS